MPTKIKLEIEGADIACRYFFNCDPDSEGVEISVDGKFIGEIPGLSIPDEYDEPETMQQFKEEVKSFLELNFII